MKWTVLILVLCLLGINAAAQQVVVTEDGKKIRLNDDKTWDYMERETGAPPAVPSKSGTEPVKTSSQPSSSPEPASSRSMPPLMLAISGAFLLIIGGLLLYFLVIMPARKQKLVDKAYRIINADKEAEFQEAEKLLLQAIESGLKSSGKAEAYFALAYVKTRLQVYEEAVIDIKKANQKADESLYLNLWLLVKLEKHKDAFEFYSTHSDALSEKLQAKELASIACLQLAKEHWRNREIEPALNYFDRVRELDIHKDQLPKSVSSHQVTLGILALFDKHFDEAEEHFKGAVQQAEKEKSSDLSAELGVLLCEWCRNKTPDIDEKLGKITQRLEKEYPAQERKPEKSEPEDELADSDADDDFNAQTKEDEALDLSDEELLVRNALLWHSVSLIFTWLHRDSKSGLPDRERESLRARLDKVRNRDAKLGDPRFIMGLIDYFFAYDTDREKAIEALEQSGVKVPEAEIIVKKEKKLIEFEKDSLMRFFAIAKKYLTDKAVPLRMRKEVIQRLERFERFKSISEELSIGEEDDEVVATLKDIQMRGMILSNRINTIMKSKLKAADEKAKKKYQELITEMEKTTAAIDHDTKQLESTEREIMLNTGEFLLNEEELLTPAKKGE